MPHLDDEALSAAVDGEGRSDEQAHVSACPACQARLDAFRSVARAVGQPVALPSSRAVDAAVNQALRAANRLSAGAAGAGPRADTPAWARAGWSEAEVPPPPVESSLRPPPASEPAPTAAPPAAAAAARLAAEPRRSVPRWMAPVAGMAAAVVIVGGLLGLLGRLGKTSSTTASLAPATSAGPARASVGAAAGSTTVALPTPFVVPLDLGDQSDAGAVAQLVRGSLSAPGSTAGSLNAPSVAEQQSISCLARARAAAGLAADPSVSLQYVARLRWRGQPAEVEVFARPGGYSGVIVKTGDCSVLAVLPL